MKNFGTIIVIFLFLVVGVVAAVVAVKFVEGQQSLQAEAQFQQMVQKYRQQSGSSAVPTPPPTGGSTPSQVTATSLTTDLQGALDDGGQSDFDQLQKDVGTL